MLNMNHNASSKKSPLIPCAHCGTLCSDPGLDTPAFCCAGCKTVYGFITGQGLETYYSMSPTPDAQTAQQEKIRDFTIFDDPTFCTTGDDGLRAITLYIEGIHCVACLWLLEKLPTLVGGVLTARVSMGDATLRLQLTADAKLSDVAMTIVSLGYLPHLIHSGNKDALWRIENRRLLIRLGVSGAIAGNLMLMSVSLYGGADGWYAMLFAWVSALLCLPLLTWGAWPFYHGAWVSLRMRRISIDVPIALALILGFLSSLLQLIGGAEHLYFDSLGMLVFFLLGSRYILTLMQRKAHRGADLHMTVLPSYVMRCGLDAETNPDGYLPDSVGQKTHVLDLRRGDVLCVSPDDIIPVDGQVLWGESEVDLGWITGESVPQPVGVRSEVYAGTRNILGKLYISVSEVGAMTRVGKLLAAIEQYPKSQFTRAMDRVAQFLLVVVLIIAAGALVFFGVNGQFLEGFNRVLALLIVTCPCALAIATPLALSNGLGRAAAEGILIRNPDVIESIAKITHVFLDKTGTLTKGFLTVKSVTVADHLPVSVADAHAIAYAMESQSKHPIGRAIARYYETGSLTTSIPIENLREVAGQGMFGEWRGHRLEMVGGRSMSATASHASLITTVTLRVDGHVVVTYDVTDTLYPDAEKLIRLLRKKHVQVCVLSGDRPEAVARLADQLGLEDTEWRGGVSPEAKTEAVSATPYTMMVGDGANDAVALKAARVGVAVHGSLEASMKAADVYLGRPGLGGVLRLMVICDQTRHVIRRNLRLSLLYNVAFCIAALMGYVTPLVASVLMPLSSLTVVISSMWPSERRS